MLDEMLNVRSSIDVGSTTNGSINVEFIGLVSRLNNLPYFLLLVVKNFIKEKHKTKQFPMESLKIKQNINNFFLNKMR